MKHEAREGAQNSTEKSYVHKLEPAALSTLSVAWKTALMEPVEAMASSCSIYDIGGRSLERARAWLG